MSPHFIQKFGTDETFIAAANTVQPDQSATQGKSHRGLWLSFRWRRVNGILPYYQTTLPPGVATTLGLGLKFCIESPTPQSQAALLQKSLRRFARIIRIHHLMRDRDQGTVSNPNSADTTYIPALYIASTWTPKRVDPKIERCLSRFQAAITRKLRLLPRRKHYNLSPLQRQCMSELRRRDDLIVFPTDKNLGPSVTNPRSTYIEQALSEHLMNKSNYEYLEPPIAKT